MARNTIHGRKVSIFKTWWFWVIIVLFLYGFISGMAGSDDADEAEESTEVSQTSCAEENVQGMVVEADAFVCQVMKGCGELLL